LCGDSVRERSEKYLDIVMEGERIAVRSNSWIDRLVVCKDCKHVAMDHQRHVQHLKEARHINTLRNMAYMYKLLKISY
jgi:hypothetical protein